VIAESAAPHGVIDTIIGPGPDTAAGVTFELTPGVLDFGTFAVNTTSDPKTVPRV
jgi:hypothetical protein